MMKNNRIMDFVDRFVSGLVAAFGLRFATIGANAGCCFILHQPEKPEMNKLRKY